MSQLETFSATIDTGCQQLDETASTCEAAIAEADDITSVYLSVGSETPTAQAQAMKEKVEAAAAQLAAAKSQLEEAQAIAHALSSGEGLLTTSTSAPPSDGAKSSTLATPWTLPAHAASNDRTPGGSPTPVMGDYRQRRGLTRENEAALTMAHAGYDIVQNPPSNAHGKDPDYVIQGEYWDCYSPGAETKIKGIHGAIHKKVSRNQASRIVVNCNDNDVNVEELQQRLQRLPIRGLDEVKIIKGDKITNVYPMEKE